MKFFLSECILFKLLAINALKLLFYKLRKIKGNRFLTKTVRHISMALPLVALVAFMN
jgi:hypothetical protein